LISSNPLSKSNAFSELLIRADNSEIRAASTWLSQTCLNFSVPVGQIDRMEICLNEALANIIEHGGKAVTLNPIKIQINVTHNSISSEASVIISDSGKAFNPIEFQPKRQTLLLENTEPGGLGLKMMKEFVDRLNYAYQDNQNQLTFSVNWDNNSPENLQ
jgi:serine/threonine-protein kinase RsbW